MLIYVDKKCPNEAMVVSRKNLSYAEKSLGDIHKSYLENYFRLKMPSSVGYQCQKQLYTY